MANKEEDKDVFGEIFLDLLSSGLGASLILMLIFSLHLSGLFSLLQSGTTEPPLPNIGDASLVSRDPQKIKESMGSIRYVTVSGLTNEDYNEIVNLGSSISSFWEKTSSGGLWTEDGFKNIPLNEEYQVEEKANAITFYYLLDHVFGNIEFNLPQALHRCEVRAGIIEGRSTVSSEKFNTGMYQFPLAGPRQYYNGKSQLKVIFRTGSLRDTRLIEIQ